MNLSNPKSLATLNTLLLVIFISIAFIVVEFAFHSTINWYGLIILIGVTSLFVYILLKYSIERFIYEKIRLIYKTISNQKIGQSKKIYNRQQSIENVYADVEKWAKEQQTQIEQLKKMQQYRQEFIGNVSHELKTPIFNIQGYVLTLLDGGLEDSQINREYLLRTEKSINRMISIIEDLEAISRLESGELQLEYKKIDLISMTKDVIEFFEMKANAKSINVHLSKHHEKPVFVMADKESLRQILTNLIDNSIKYGKEYGTTKISFFDMDENMLIEITDNGIGIEKQYIPRLFERFYRVDKSRSREQGGSGLGLAIVKHLIEAHNQTINVRSTPNIGTTFAFTMKKA